MADIEMEQRLVVSLEEALETLQKRFSSTLRSSMPATAASGGLMDVRHSTAGSPSSDPQVSTPRTPSPLTTDGARENAREDSVLGNDLVPQMDFPQFDGEDASTWLDKCVAYFTLYNIPEYFRVTAATLHLSGQATQWFQSCKDVVGILDWDQFRQAVLTEFEVSAHKDNILALLTLKQTGSVEDFRKDFESLVYHIRLYENNLSDTFLVTQFVHGLKHELRALVDLQMPESVSHAACLASKHEKLLGNQSATHLQQGMVGQAIFTDDSVDEGVDTLYGLVLEEEYGDHQPPLPAESRAESQTISFEMGLTEVEQWRPVLEKVDDLELEPDCVIFLASSPASRPQASSTGAVAMESVLDSVHVSTTAASTDVAPSSYQPTNLAGLRLKASVPVSTMDNNVPLWPLNAAATPTPTLVVPYGVHIGAPTKCSSMGLDIDTDSGEVNITPLLVVSMSKDITKPMVISEFFLSELFAGVEFIFLLPTKYLMYCVSCVTDSDLHEVINIGTLVPASVIAGWVLRGAECFNFDPGITISMFCNNGLEQWPPPTSVCIICSNIDVRPIPWPSFGMSKGCPGSELSWIWKPPWLHLPWQIIRWKSVTVHSLNWEFSSGPLHPTQGITFQTLVLLSRNTSSTCIKFCLEVGSSSSSGHVTDSAYFLELPQGYWSNLHQLCLSGVELKQPYVMVLCTFSMCTRGGYLLIVWLEGILGAGICTKIDGVAAVLEKKVGQGIQADYSRFVVNLIGDNVGNIVAREAEILECIAAEIITVVILRRTMREHCRIEDILDCTLVFSWCYFPCPDDNSEGVVLILHQEKLPYVVVQREDATLLIGYGRSDWKLPWLWDPIKSFQEGCLVCGRLCLELFRSLLFAIQLTQEGSFRCKGNFWLYPQVFLLACCQSKGTKDCKGVSFKFLEDNVFCMMVSSARLAVVLTDELHRMLENDGTTVHGAMKQLIFTCMVKELEKVLAVNFYEHRLEDKPNLEGRIMSCIGSLPYGLVSGLTMTGHIAEGHKRNGKRRVTASNRIDKSSSSTSGSASLLLPSPLCPEFFFL